MNMCLSVCLYSIDLKTIHLHPTAVKIWETIRHIPGKVFVIFFKNQCLGSRCSRTNIPKTSKKHLICNICLRCNDIY